MPCHRKYLTLCATCDFSLSVLFCSLFRVGSFVQVDAARQVTATSKAFVSGVASGSQASGDAIRSAHNMGFCVSTADTAQHQLQFFFGLRLSARQNAVDHQWLFVSSVLYLAFVHADGLHPSCRTQSPNVVCNLCETDF